MVWKLPAGEGTQDALLDVAEDVGARRTGHELRSRCLENREQLLARRRGLAVRACEVRLRGVSPVAVRPNDDIGDDRVALLGRAAPGHSDGAADLRSVGAGEEIADEFDWATRCDLGGRLRSREELDLLHSGP